MIGARLISFSLLSWAVSSFELADQPVSVLGLVGLSKEKPAAVAAFLFSLLSLSGMPLTLGFPPLQTMYQNLADGFLVNCAPNLQSRGDFHTVGID